MDSQPITLDETVRALAQERATCEELDKIVDACQKVLEATPAYQALHSAKEQALVHHKRALDIEGNLREWALAAYRANGNKTPLKGVTIKVFKRLIYDAAQAEAWCRQNAPTLFKWDVKGFEKAAEKLPGAPITIEDDPRVTLASDLSEYLEA